VKGTSNFPAIYTYSRTAQRFATLRTSHNVDLLADHGSRLHFTEQNATIQKLTTYPNFRGLVGSINARDTLLFQNIPNGTPSQFLTEYANCRLFWTAPMISDITNVWKAAARVAFQGDKCAAGFLPKWEGGADQKVDIMSQVVEKVRLAPITHEKRLKDALWDARHGRKMII